MQSRSVLVSEHIGLSTLDSEAVAAAEALGARVLASNRDGSPGIRQACGQLGIGYSTIDR